MGFQRKLLEEYQKRKSKNPRFSLRSFAKYLGVDPSLLSKIMSGKRAPSAKFYALIKDKVEINLDLGPDGDGLDELDFKDQFYPAINLTDEQQSEIGWAIPAAFEYLKIVSKCPDVTTKSILSHYEINVEELIKHLTDLGVIVLKKGRHVPASDNVVAFSKKLTTKQKKDLQKKYGEMSLDAIERIDFTQRDHSTLTIAIASQNMDKYRSLIRQFQKKLMKLSDHDIKHADNIANVHVALYPVLNLK